MTERVELGTGLGRALRLRCPRCGGGKMFASWIRMYPDCPNCKFKYERGPGYFLGSAYINYGLTSLLITVAYVVLRFGFELSNLVILPPLVAFCVIFPLFFFRYARAVWLAADSFFDREGGEEM